MRILLTGGTGLIGRALCNQWHIERHEVFVWSRSPQQVAPLCYNARGIAKLEELNHISIDAVVNLAGAPIADRHGQHKGGNYCGKAVLTSPRPWWIG